MPGYMTSTVVSARLDAMVRAADNDNALVCTRSGSDWLPGSGGGPSSGYVKIAATTPDSPPARWSALLTGGIHGNELAPPDALVSFLDKLLAAYAAKSDVVYPAWTDPVSGIVYGAFTIPWPWVRSVVEKLDLYVVPLVTDEGRDFSLTSQPWRKNRRPAPTNPPPTPGPLDPPGICVGVDIDRNFNIAWDFATFYDVTTASLDTSPKPCNGGYVGSGAESENETQNVANLMRSKNISFYLDFHMFSRDILFPWAIETNQSKDPAMNFANFVFDHHRDGNTMGAYKEYIPAAAAQAHRDLAQAISGDILSLAGGADPRARQRSLYGAQQLAKLYVAPGTAVDYCFSRWFTMAKAGTPISPVMAFVVEVGADKAAGPDFDDGGFAPDYAKQYPKLEREIHVAAWAFLSRAAAKPFQGPSAPPSP